MLEFVKTASPLRPSRPAPGKTRRVRRSRFAFNCEWSSSTSRSATPRTFQTMIDPNIVGREILDMGMDDYFGIYEIIWRINTLWPEASIGDKYVVADTVLRRLLRVGHVSLVRELVSQPGRHVESLSESQHDELLREPTAWYPSALGEPPTTIAYLTNKTGEARYNELSTVA